jgi:hypothetical protein
MDNGTSNLKAARLAAVAALIGALIGAAVPGVFLLASTDRQVEGETDRSRAEFLRLQRQEAYAKFATDVRALDRTVRARGVFFDNDQDCPSLIDTNEKYEGMMSALSLVNLIGSTSVRTAAAEAIAIFEFFPYAPRCIVGGTEKALPRIEFQVKVSSDEHVIGLDDFIAEARKDLVG